MNVLAAVGRFPNTIQPWVLNSIEQVVRHGGQVWVASNMHGDAIYPSKVDELRLRDRTLYICLGSVSALFRVLAEALSFSSGGRLTRRGLWRLLVSGRVLRGGGRQIANRLIKSPLFGLRGIAIIHTHSMVTAYEYVEVAKALGVPLVHTFHGLRPEGVGQLSESKRMILFEHLATCLVNTNFARRQVTSLGCPPEKIRIMPQGLPLEEFPFSPRSWQPGEPLQLLTVGRLDPDKGHRYVLEAVRRLLDRDVPVEYRIVGAGPERESLERMTRELSINDRVVFTGSLGGDDLLAEYQHAHVFVLASVRAEQGGPEETQGVVIQEAQASGKIVVATRTGGIPECVEDGVSAFLVPDRDGESLALKLSEIAAHPERWAGWQRAGREWVETHFDVRVIGDRLWALYQELTSSRA